jgi:predicted metal-dependent hydrolase
MSRKSARIARMVEPLRDEELDPFYAGYFDCFNRQLYFEAHEVLEQLWLKDKSGPNGAFYKGLIQLAGAFVHLQKNRLRPAAALFKLALANLGKYPDKHERLDGAAVCGLIRNWIEKLETARLEKNPFTGVNAPELALDLPQGGVEHG